jgi:putative exporter of polyketide antibiotics
VNRGLVNKALRELWPTTLLVGLLVATFEGLIAVVLPRYESELGLQVLRMPFVKRIIEGMLGTRVAEQVGPEIIWSIPWAHPVMLSLILAHAVICSTRLPAGEVDRGTIDIALGLPISRWQWFRTDSLLWLGSAMLVIALLMTGNRVGSTISGSDRMLSLLETTIIYVNLLGVYLAVGGGGWLISSLSDRRGKAITITFVLIVTSFLISYLEQFWEPARFAAWFSVLSYNRPLFVFRDGAWPVRDLSVLYGAAVAFWTSAAVVFTRRDLCTT